MKNNFECILLASLIIFVCSCHQATTEDDIRKWQQEIMDAEANFARMVSEEGLHKSFVHFADQEAVLMRNNSLIKGLDKIDQLYSGNNTTTLSWVPDTVHVSNSGDLAYTYGEYVYTYTDTTGTKSESKGIFHSIWKRQSDGTWKYVWD